MSSFGSKKTTGAPRKKRRSSRDALNVPATVVTTACRISATVADISTGGAGLLSPTPPEIGRDVQMRIAGHTLFGAVAWASEDSFGVSFDQKLDYHSSAKMDEAVTASISEKVVAKRLAKDQR